MKIRIVSGSHQIGPMGEILNRLQQDSLFQFSKNVRDKFSDLAMLETNTTPSESKLEVDRTAWLERFLEEGRVDTLRFVHPTKLEPKMSTE